MREMMVDEHQLTIVEPVSGAFLQQIENQLTRGGHRRGVHRAIEEIHQQPRTGRLRAVEAHTIDICEAEKAESEAKPDRTNRSFARMLDPVETLFLEGGD